jgi:post-segregation antitoxin (ccd killing protein)
MRMARIQVYVPDDLYRAVKDFDLPASELFQKAVADEVHRREVLRRAEEYYAELIAEVGEPTDEEIAAAHQRRVERREQAEAALKRP